ncbi:MAG TPA: hypothetical protein VK684_02675 [Edaphobacter sp.]|jgi:hypothetical protein|nr:hypothetical protein [Edaphobacter sp.]
MPNSGAEGPPNQSSSLDDKLKVVEGLVKLFQLERMVHLTTTIVSLLMLLASASFMIVRSRADPATLTLIFGSSGLITYSANRLLRMWDQAIKLMLENK